MKKISLPLLILIMVLIRCSGDTVVTPGARQQITLSPVDAEIIQANNRFGFELMRRLPEVATDSNVVISPLSISMALGMTLNGADGTTFDSMQTVLGFDGLTNDEINESYRNLINLLLSLDPDVVMEIANSIWIRQNFAVLSDFIDVNRHHFDAEIRTLDFTLPTAVDIINGWIADQTRDRITDLLDYIPEEAVMYLINAIYFNGTWTTAFDEDETYESTFYVDETTEMPVDMMVLSDTISYYADKEFQIVELPYGNGDFSMLIMLPADETGISGLVASLNEDQLAQWINGLEPKYGTVNLPRFGIKYNKLLNNALCDMGMGIAFSGLADFSRINGTGGLLISRVLHETFLQVDEAGTEAAAATIVEVLETSATPGEFRMRVDRPFILAIRETSSNAILFLGKISRPERIEF